MQSKKISIGLTVALAMFGAFSLTLSTHAVAQAITVLHRFGKNSTDGAGPIGSLILDAEGNLYGTTAVGGICGGTIFELSPKPGGGWSEHILHSWDCMDYYGAEPTGGLALDGAGNLYGTTRYGGPGKCYSQDNNGLVGCGTVFELTRGADGGWTEKVLHNFTDSTTDGANPNGNLIFDATGNLYGTTLSGGVFCTTKGNIGCGTAFELTPAGNGSWRETLLHRFGEGGNGTGTDGIYPLAGLVFDGSGNLYGTPTSGGSSTLCSSCGTVFELSPDASGHWQERVLHNFSDTGGDGKFPNGGLAFDNSGSLYGTTVSGGVDGFGTVFKLTPLTGGWTKEVLNGFKVSGDGGYAPIGGLVLDQSGNLYATTSDGGAGLGYGTVFELTPAAGGGWTETILFGFGLPKNAADGADPQASLILDAAGNLYGTAPEGGIGYQGINSGDGTVFEITH